MAKFCTECGKEIAEGVAFCTECGAKAPADPVTETAETVTGPVETGEKAPAVYSPPAQNSGQARRLRPTPPEPEPAVKTVGTGAYFGLMLLFALPLIGQIACIIMAFAPKNKNIRNYARAKLIWMIITIVLIGVLIALASVLTNTLLEAIAQTTGAEYGSWGEIFSDIGNLEGYLG